MMHHGHQGNDSGHKTCKVCTAQYSHEHNPSRFGICEKCAYKILIILFIVMIVAAYVAWFGII